MTTDKNTMPVEIVVSKSGRWCKQMTCTDANMIDTFPYVSRDIYDEQDDTIEAKDRALKVALKALKDVINSTAHVYGGDICQSDNFDLQRQAIAQIERNLK